jgi:vacuolar-type H+-ATPase subunit C/Vma6
LKEFFKAYKILWDVENLKMVLCSLLDEHPTQREGAIKGPSKHLDSVDPLLETHNFEETLKNAMKLLPADFSSRIKIEEDQTIRDLLFSLDLAVFEYLQKKSEDIGTRRTQLTWEIVAGVYEIENIITMGRLKYFDIPPERIREFLFPVQKHLEGSEVKRLLEAEDYSDFLRVSRGTTYKEFIPQGEVNPRKLESLLKNQKRNLKTEEMLQEEAVETVANFLIKLGDQYDIIREASFLLLLEEGGKKQT